jgi:aspartyl-tRNA synthetase
VTATALRTHRAGDLRPEHAGSEVVVCGWASARRDHGGVVFLDVRDAAGIVQVVVDPEQPGNREAHRVRSEFVVRIEGDVRVRPEGTSNPELATGGIEVAARRLEILGEAETTPIPVDGRRDVDETLR